MGELALITVPTNTNLNPILAHLCLIFRLVRFQIRVSITLLSTCCHGAALGLILGGSLLLIDNHRRWWLLMVMRNLIFVWITAHFLYIWVVQTLLSWVATVSGLSQWLLMLKITHWIFIQSMTFIWWGINQIDNFFIFPNLWCGIEMLVPKIWNIHIAMLC
jgi:hypothetical protein